MLLVKENKKMVQKLNTWQQLSPSCARKMIKAKHYWISSRMSGSKLKPNNAPMDLKSLLLLLCQLKILFWCPCCQRLSWTCTSWIRHYKTGMIIKANKSASTQNTANLREERRSLYIQITTRKWQRIRKSQRQHL